MSFYVLAFPTSVGSTTALPDPKSLVGIAGLMVGTGEVSGAIGWGLVNKWAKVWGRGIVIISSTFCHITAFVLLYLSIPEDAPFGEVFKFHFYLEVILICFLEYFGADFHCSN